MQIDWIHFTPQPAAFGGLLIGLAAALTLLLLGRVAGVSGVFEGALTRRDDEFGWRAAFLLGLVAAPAALGLAIGAARPELPGAWPLYAVSGLLVGFGASLGSGCTSGHGVCGLSRLSPRSLVATLSFMASGAATVFVARHLIG